MLQVDEQPEVKADVLGLSLEGLREALAIEDLGCELRWAESIGNALRRVQRALRQHRRVAKAPDGPLGVDETRPTLARQADILREDFDLLLTQISDLRDKAWRLVGTNFSPVPDRSSVSPEADLQEFRTLRSDAEQLLARLQEDRNAETKLVLDSINTDIGAGD
jgi:hypothetical protein